MRDKLSGNEAVATAMKQINPDVVAAFPITPSTEVPQYFSAFVNNGQVTTEFIPVESEHSSMSATIGAEAAGALWLFAKRAFIFSGERAACSGAAFLPVVWGCVRRGLRHLVP